jgi:hypothetical protein
MSSSRSFSILPAKKGRTAGCIDHLLRPVEALGSKPWADRALPALRATHGAAAGRTAAARDLHCRRDVLDRVSRSFRFCGPKKGPKWLLHRPHHPVRLFLAGKIEKIEGRAQPMP